MKKYLLAVVAAILVTGTLSFAQVGADVRKQDQDARVQQGVDNGTVTPGQAQRLDNHAQRIDNRADAEAAANGGKQTPAEKAQTNRQLKRNSRRIYNQKHNG